MAKTMVILLFSMFFLYPKVTSSHFCHFHKEALMEKSDELWR